MASSSSSPDETITGPTNLLLPDDFRFHQQLLKQVAMNLSLEVEELKEPTDSIFDILAAAAPCKVALPVHDGVVKLVTALCQTPSSLPSTSKSYIPAKGFEYMYSHPPLGSLVVSAANDQTDRDRQVPHQKIRMINGSIYLVGRFI